MVVLKWCEEEALWVAERGACGPGSLLYWDIVASISPAFPRRNPRVLRPL